MNHFPAGSPTQTASPDVEWHTPGAGIQAAAQAGAPLVWLGGTEPLSHPGIGEVSAAIAESGRYVFLHTSGAGLRQRIHEFRPVPRLYLTLEIPLVDGTASTAPSASNGKISFQSVAEAIRVVRLSGFFLCAHFTIDDRTAHHAVAARLKALETAGVDGVAVSSGGRYFGQSSAPAVALAVAEATRLIPSAGWRSFSRLLEASHQQAAAPQKAANREAPRAGACGETA